jgi:transposase
MASKADLEKQLREKDLIIVELRATVAELRATVIELQETIVELRQYIAELQRQLGLNSSNSSKPPSSDGFKKPSRTQSLREKSGKKSGGQPGHMGATLQQIENPDIIEYVKVDCCPHCQASLEKVPTQGFYKQQVRELPSIRAQVIEYQCETKCCPNCHKKVTAQKEGLSKAPAQYGASVQSVVAYLYVHNLLPMNRIAQFMKDVLCVPISDATIESMVEHCADSVAPVVNDIEAQLQTADIKCADESGLRVVGKNHWLHVLCTDLLVHYRASERRGDVPQNTRGVLVHDHWSSYYSKNPNAQHAICNAHILRELIAASEIDKERWANKMLRVLRCGCRLAKSWPGGIPQDLVKKLRDLYMKILAEGREYHEKLAALPQKSRGKTKRRPGHNLLMRLQSRADDTLRFLENPAVPFTNNSAEQALRMIKVKQNASGSYRTLEGANRFLTVRSYTATAQRHGINVFDALVAACNKKPLSFACLGT